MKDIDYRDWVSRADIVLDKPTAEHVVLGQR